MHKVPRFSYIAARSDGARVQAVEEAADAKAMAATLRSGGLSPISIREMGAQPLFAGRKERKAGGRPKLTDVAAFIRQISALLTAGVALVSALDDLSKQQDKPQFARVIDQVRSRVMAGAPLSAALKEHPRVFSSLICAMIRAGEESGNLEGITSDLAAYLDSQISLRRKIRAALAYPVFIAIFFTGAVTLLFVWLLPKFRALFMGFGAQLPIITRYALDFSAWISHWFVPIAAVVVALVVGIRLAARSKRGRALVDRATLKLPIFGKLTLKVVLVRFLETLATLQRSGVPILMSLDIASDTAGNAVVQAELQRAKREVMQGSFLSRELAKSPLFPRMMVRMLAVGEDTGRVEDLLQRAARYYKEEVEATVQTMTSLIEPVLIVFMGVVVAFVVLSIYLPIFRLASAVTGGG
jgi:type IV pilus assembly protein PilC